MDGEERYPTKPIEVRYDESVQDARNQAVNQKNDAANQLNSLYEEIEKQVDAIPRRVPRPYEAMAGLTEQQLEENRLRAAKRLVEDAKEVLEEAGRKGKTSFIAGLGRGIADKIADPENWNFGITDLADNKYLLDQNPIFLFYFNGDVFIGKANGKDEPVNGVYYYLYNNLYQKLSIGSGFRDESLKDVTYCPILPIKQFDLVLQQEQNKWSVCFKKY